VSKILGSYNIESLEHQQVFKVDVVEGLDPPHLDFINATWKPLLIAKHNSAILEFFTLPESQQTPAKWDYKERLHGAPDAHWDWGKKCAAAPGANRKIYGLLNGDDVEGAMVIKFGETTRVGLSQGLLYVDFVSVAPWNRAEIQNPQRFNGLGRLLMGAAVALSISEGLDGRCGLHSLPSAEGFYRRIGMADLGPDPAKDGLRYFEFDADAAKNSLDGDGK
jgi:hypothetical protein